MHPVRRIPGYPPVRHPLHPGRLPVHLWAGGELHVVRVSPADAPVFPGPSPSAAVPLLLPAVPELHHGRVPVGGPVHHLPVLRADEPQLLCLGGAGGVPRRPGRGKDLSDHRGAGRPCDPDGPVPAVPPYRHPGHRRPARPLRRGGGPLPAVGGGAVHLLRLCGQGGRVPTAHLAAQGPPGGPGPGQRPAVRRPHQGGHLRRPDHHGGPSPRRAPVGHPAAGAGRGDHGAGRGHRRVLQQPQVYPGLLLPVPDRVHPGGHGGVGPTGAAQRPGRPRHGAVYDEPLPGEADPVSAGRRGVLQHPRPGPEPDSRLRPGQAPAAYPVSVRGLLPGGYPGLPGIYQ